VTPGVSVSTFGQTIQVGAVRPPAALSWSGTGQVDLFGEGSVATVQHFQSFVRPLIVWQEFNQVQAASQFLQAGTGGIQAGTGGTAAAVSSEVGRIGQALASGWEQYLIRLVALAVVIGVALHLALLGSRVLLRRHEVAAPRRPLAWVASTAVLSLVVTVASAGMTVASASRQLHGVTSLADLVGTAQLAPLPRAPGPTRTGVDVVVIGDSTAAGDGNALVPHPSREDSACHRSSDSYGSDLQAVTGSQVLNLSCSSATIAAGLLGVQSTHGLTLQPQVSTLQSVSGESAIVVSIGANDIGWQAFIAYCALAQQCDDRATAQLFQSRLDRFKVQYAQLLQQLADLPGHPSVIVNQYYDPFGTDVSCLLPAATPSGSPPTPTAPATTSPQTGALATRARTLSSEIAELNSTLAQGAQAFHDLVVHPDFSGHELCTAQPWVQGVTGRAPLHPNAAGELAIAAADIPRIITATGVGTRPSP
jgi:lysophospholipase L1-like esterase